MKPPLTLLPLLLAVIVLSGCPDSKMPKVPPSVPEPKAVYVPSSTPPTDAPMLLWQRHWA